MRRLLVHIGTGKTGTTSIQRSLLAAQRNGSLGPVSYPEFFGSQWTFGNSHAVLGYVYRPHRTPRVFRSQRHQDALARLLPGFEKELGRQFRRSNSIVLSSESLSGMNADEVARFRADLEPFSFDDVLIVVYVRNPADIYLSLAQQAVRASSAITDPRHFRYRFRTAISTWSAAFGGKIVVRPFDRALLHQGCVVRDFARIAADFFGQEMAGVTAVDANESLSAEAAVVLQRYRKAFHDGMDGVHLHDSSRLVRLLRESQASLPQTRPRLRPGIDEIIMSSHRDDLAWLRAEHGIDFPGRGAGPASTWAPGGSEIQVADIMEYRDEIVQQLLLHALRSALAAPVVPQNPAQRAGLVSALSALMRKFR